MKKILALGFIMFFGGLFNAVFAGFQYIKVDGDYLNVYGTGFDKYTQFEGTINGKKLNFERVVNSGHVQFLNQKDFLEGSFVFKGVNYNYTGSSVKTNLTTIATINIYKPFDFILSYLRGEFSGSGYKLIGKFDGRDDTSSLNFYVNNQKISTGDIVWDGNKSFIINYKRGTSFLDNNARLSVRTTDRRLNQSSVRLPEYNIDLSLFEVKKEGDLLKGYFNIGATNVETYLDDKSLEKNRFGIQNGKLFVEMPYSNTKSIYKIYVKDGERRSRDIYFDVSSYANPHISRIDLGKNSIGETNKIYGTNIDNIYSKVKIVINGKEFAVSTTDYSKYVLSGDKVIYGFDSISDRYDFAQPLKYLTGENVVQVIVDGKKSNEIRFDLSSKKNKLIFDALDFSVSSNNLSFTYNLPTVLSGTNTQNQDINIGSINIGSGDSKTYILENVVLDLELKDLEYLPIDYIKLKDTYGFITDLGSKKYRIEFSSIYLDNLSSLSLPLTVRLSNNYKKVSFSLIPKDISYYKLNGYSSSTKSISQKLSGNYPVSFLQNYNPCFDVSSDYSNCKKAGYNDKFYISYIILTNQSKQQEIQVKLDEKLQKKADGFILKLDNLVKKLVSKKNVKTSDSDYTSMLYKKINSLIENKTSKVGTSAKPYWDYVKFVLKSKIK